MGFRIKRKETTTEAVRRVTCECVEKALGDLNHGDGLAAVHSVRKEIKKARAILRLVRPCMGRSAYRKAARDLREAAQDLSPMRDRLVTLQAMQDLRDGLRDERGATPFGNLVSALRQRCRQEERRFRRERVVKQAARILVRSAKCLGRLSPRKKGWRALVAGLKRSYRAGRRAYTEVIAEPTPENLHEWRKRVKDLWYQLRLLRRVAPGELENRIKDLKALSDYLGDGHDLFMLQETVGALWRGVSQADELGALRGLAERRQDRLSCKAKAIGKRVYREKLSKFCRRIEGYWDNWR